MRKWANAGNKSMFMQCWCSWRCSVALKKVFVCVTQGCCFIHYTLFYINASKMYTIYIIFVILYIIFVKQRHRHYFSKFLCEMQCLCQRGQLHCDGQLFKDLIRPLQKLYQNGWLVSHVQTLLSLVQTPLR